ncbi:MFS transporter [Streptomyces sp. V2]|uniref:MFS transporter n=1 Tax=Streptomyces niveiscabiei TaxID=164115 RepID=A0ABW9I0X4_9ACTN|nr:MFS transporter [Streptomyces sp. V2]PWG08185.1 MFS transporter [Streptomyces sp. V2]
MATDLTQPPPTAAPGHPQRWLILGVIALAQLTVLLDNTVLNVAIPSLKGELGASTSDVQWMINAYSLVQAGLLLTAGSAADRYGRKKMLVTGLVLFGAGSLAAALASSTGQLIAARAGMGVGGALLTTTTLALAMQIFPPDEQPRAIGIWAAVNSLGFAAGPLIGGFMLGHFWWGAIFLINLPVAAGALAAVLVLVPESKNPEGDRPDLLGAVLSTVGMSSLVFTIISGPEHGWSSARVLGSGVVAVVVLAVFAWWESRVPYPMLDMSFFRNRRFTGAVAGAVLVMFGMGGALFLLTQHLQLVLGYGPLEAGFRTAPLAAVIILLNFTGAAAKITLKLGGPMTILLGMLVMASGLVSIGVLGERGYAGTLLGLVLIGVGTATASPAMGHAIMSSIPPAKAGVGAGINGMLAEFGMGLGVAALGAVLTSAPSLEQGLREGQLVGAVAVAAGGMAAGVLLRRAADTKRPGLAGRRG